MSHKRIGKKKFIKRVSTEAVALLLDQAEKNFINYPKRSKRYVEMAFVLVKKYRIRLSREQGLRFCKKCCIYWVPDSSVKITFEPKRHAMLFTCQCGAKRRIIVK